MTTTPHRTAGHVRQVMAEHKVSAMPVVGPDGEAVGVVTATDLLDQVEELNGRSILVAKQDDASIQAYQSAKGHSYAAAPAWLVDEMEKLIDEEIVELIAHEANVSPDWVDLVARETGSEGMLSRMLLKLGPLRKGYVEFSLESNPGYLDGNLYISLLHRIIPRIAVQDNVVLVGRGSQYILADHPRSLHILMIADLEFRIRFVMENYHLDRRQAQIVVAKQSKRRLNLYRYFGRTDYDQPDLYHVVFNMNKVTLEDAIQTVCFMADSQSS